MSEPLILLVVVALAAALAVSGAAKLGRRADTVSALEQFHVPFPGLHGVLAAALPFAELAAAAGLLAAPSVLYTVVAAATVALTAVFLALVLSALSRGDEVECACFGGLSTRPVGRSTLVRNTVLLAASVVALTGGSTGALAGLAALGREGWLVLLAASTVAAVGMLVAIGIRARLTPAATATAAVPTASGPTASGDAGAEWPVPDLEITDPGGDAIELAAVAEERPVLLVLLSAECTPCARLAERLPGWQSVFGDAVRIAVLTSAPREVFHRQYPHLGLPVYYGYRALLTAAGIPGVPSALLLSTRRTVAAGPVIGLDEVQGLAEAIGGLVAVDEPDHPHPHHDASALTGPR